MTLNTLRKTHRNLWFAVMVFGVWGVMNGLRHFGAGGTYVDYSASTTTVPFTWANGDMIFAAGTYEAA